MLRVPNFQKMVNELTYSISMKVSVVWLKSWAILTHQQSSSTNSIDQKTELHEQLLTSQLQSLYLLSSKELKWAWMKVQIKMIKLCLKLRKDSYLTIPTKWCSWRKRWKRMLIIWKVSIWTNSSLLIWMLKL